ncbi:MAG: hypothetical protein ACP5PM_04400 [Acidimicrobiales bacterium]
MTARASGGSARTVTDLRFQVVFAVLFPVPAPPGSFAGFLRPADGIDPLPEDAVQARMDQLHDVQAAILGQEYLATRRTTRWPLGRVRLPEDEGTGPAFADVFLVTHTGGGALWEAWMAPPDQPLEPDRFLSWLRSDQKSPVAALREALGRLSRELLSGEGPDEGFPFTVLRLPGDTAPLDAVVAAHAEDLVRVLYLDRSKLAFKRRIVDEELARDFCLREGGISLVAGRGALDLRVGECVVADPPSGTVLVPRSALPLLISIELLLVERVVLQMFLRLLAGDGVPRSLSHLLELKTEMLDGLAEYRGTVAESNRFSAEVTSYGEKVLGLDVLYATLTERLDALTFDITTRYQQSTNTLQFALTVVLGSFQAASVAAVIASVAYRQGPLLVLAWAAGTAIVAATTIAALLRRRLR